MNNSLYQPQPITLKDVFMKEALLKALDDLIALVDSKQLTGLLGQLRTLAVHEVESPEGKRLGLIELAPITTSEDGQENWNEIRSLSTHEEQETNTLYILVEPTYAKEIAVYLDHKFIQELPELQLLTARVDEATLMLLMKNNLEAQEARKSPDAPVI